MWRQPVETSDQRLAQPRVIQPFPRRWPRVRHVGRVIVIDMRSCTSARFDGIEHAVARDGEQPGAHARSTAESGQIAKRRDEHLLLDVVGQRRIPQCFAAIAIYRGPVSLHQASKRTAHVLVGDQTEHITIGICSGREFSHIAGNPGLRVRRHEHSSSTRCSRTRHPCSIAYNPSNPITSSRVNATVATAAGAGSEREGAAIRGSLRPPGASRRAMIENHVCTETPEDGIERPGPEVRNAYEISRGA